MKKKNQDIVLQLQTSAAMAAGLNKFRKELIKVGHYVKESTNQTFDVSLDLLNHWVKTFKRWVKNGNKLPVPPGHNKADEPESNQGWVTDMFVEGDGLYGMLELLNPELAKVTDVSIYVPASFTDGGGHKYKLPITHVSLCTDPVIIGLQDFEQLSLSLSIGDSNMLELKKLAALLNVEEDALTEDIIIAALDPKKVMVQAPEATVAAVAASQEKPIAVDPMVVKLMGENRTAKLTTLLNAGLITPAVKDIIEKRYVEKEALTLSLSHGADDGFDTLYEVLTKNKAISFDEKSDAQLLELSNVRASAAKNPIQADIKKRRKAAGMKD